MSSASDDVKLPGSPLPERAAVLFQSLRGAAERHLRRLGRPALLGTLRRTTPISDVWGYDRGTPIDRHYIDRFLERHRGDIRGRVLEVRDARYATRYAAPGAIVDVLDVDPTNPRATIVADLAAAEAIAPARFDCFILTMTLQYIRDVPAALIHARRILRPGGVLLAAMPCVGGVDPRHLDGDLWRFTPASCAALFTEAFGPGAVQVEPYGNVLSSMAALTGLAAEELTRAELAAADPRFPVVACVRATRAAAREGACASSS